MPKTYSTKRGKEIDPQLPMKQVPPHKLIPEVQIGEGDPGENKRPSTSEVQESNLA